MFFFSPGPIPHSEHRFRRLSPLKEGCGKPVLGVWADTYDYVRAWTLCIILCCIHSLSEGADRVGGQLRGDKECPFNGVTNSGRILRKVPESDARIVARGVIYPPFRRALTASVNGCAEIFLISGVTSSGRVWRKVPESDALSVLIVLSPSMTS